MNRFARWILVVVIVGGAACGSDSGQSPPPGACKTGGTATGSFSTSCNQCALDHCDKELKDKSGSGWAMQYFGGDGACAAFNGCICQCLAGGMNAITCVVSPDCAAKIDAPCRAATTTAQQCLTQNCRDVCR